MPRGHRHRRLGSARLVSSVSPRCAFTLKIIACIDFLNRKIYALNIAVNKRKSTKARAPLCRCLHTGGGTRLLISYRSIMLLIYGKASGSLPELMSMQRRKHNPNTAILVRNKHLDDCYLHGALLLVQQSFLLLELPFL